MKYRLFLGVLFVYIPVSSMYHSLYVLCCRYVCEAEMEVTRAKLAAVVKEISRVTPLTPDGNRIQSWPIGMFYGAEHLSILVSVSNAMDLHKDIPGCLTYLTKILKIVLAVLTLLFFVVSVFSNYMHNLVSDPRDCQWLLSGHTLT